MQAEKAGSRLVSVLCPFRSHTVTNYAVPTGALDEQTGRQVLDYICRLKDKHGFTIVMVTHNLNIAEMAKTVIKMNSGRVSDTYTNEIQKTAYEIGW